jgi:hypothetical protein
MIVKGSPEIINTNPNQPLWETNTETSNYDHKTKIFIDTTKNMDYIMIK